jgi:hypothetical protein
MGKAIFSDLNYKQGIFSVIINKNYEVNVGQRTCKFKELAGFTAVFRYRQVLWQRILIVSDVISY